MNNFKDTLRAYAAGTLSDEEKAAVEKELDHLEEYQTYVDEVLGDSTSAGKSEEGTNQIPLTLSEIPGADKEKKLIFRGKWKARIFNAITLLCILLLLLVLSLTLTGVYYMAGNPGRSDLYTDTVISTIAVTKPNVTLRQNSTEVNPLSLFVKGNLIKQVGSSRIVIGQFSQSFFFSKAGQPVINYYTEQEVSSQPSFLLPNSSRDNFPSDWTQLEKLPEGTVSEVYLSLDRYYSTNEVLKKLEGKTMLPTWFAVDCGPDSAPDYSMGTISMPIGFPYYPIWHHNDWTQTSYQETKGPLLSKTVSASYSAPTVEDYGSGELRNKNFIQTLQLIRNHKGIASSIDYNLSTHLDQILQYVDQKGVRLYGVVVTGPTKEILKLEKESWVSAAKLGETHLWNWQDF